MPKYRDSLPQLGNSLFMTDAGMETDLIFHHNLELPEFASFHLLKDASDAQTMMDYYRDFAQLARDTKRGLVLEAPTWRANRDWGNKLGYGSAELAEANRKGVAMMAAVRDEFETTSSPMVISGCIGPRGDGYVPGNVMTSEEAAAYHLEQILVLRDTEVDMVSAFTMNYVEEAIGITLAAKEAGLPLVLSFTVETDGKLPTGMSLKDAIATVDEVTEGYPVYYMINCAHPTHFAHVLEDGPWLSRIGGLRTNSSKKSHAELNESEQLDDGNPQELGAEHVELRKKLPALKVIGGCCGTDIRHVREIFKALDEG